MSRKSFIDSVEVAEPCSENWREMEGTDKIRFCSHCSKHVNNLSEMTRKEAMRLVRASDGNLCVRYVHDPVTRRPLFANPLAQITRRSPAFAAGVMTASLALSPAVYAQSEAPVLAVSRTDKAARVDGDLGSVSGTVTDQNGAVIPAALISITNEETGSYRVVNTNIEGNYEFKDLPAGKYRIKFEAGGFEPREISSVYITDGGAERRDSQLDVQKIIEMVQVGGDVKVEQFVTVGMIVSVSTEKRNGVVVAVQNEELDEVKALIMMGMRVNVQDKGYDRITPLHAALESGNVEITRFLLEHGARVNARDGRKRTPLMMLDDDATPELIQLMIPHRVKLDLTDKLGNTALTLAAGNVGPEVLKALIDAGADVNKANKQGQTALMNAAYEDDLESVRLLLLAGAEVNARNKEGDSAWDLATDDEIEKLLETYGAETYTDEEDQTVDVPIVP